MKRGALSLSLLALLAVLLLPRQTAGRQNPPLVISSMYGRDLYEFYCAPCHGRDGTGHGPAVPALTTPLPDLTTIAQRSGGTFPTARVAAFVTGEPEPLVHAHGSKDMPVWGPIFRALDPNDRMNKVRIQQIVDYIESIQAK